MQIAERTFVTLHYTLTDSKGDVLDSSEGPDDAEPLSYVHGAGMIVPGLEAALLGKSAGDQVKVTVGPEDGYGAHHAEAICVAARQPHMRFVPTKSFEQSKPQTLRVDSLL